jgi:adenosylhomocysteine nucleosidase
MRSEARPIVQALGLQPYRIDGCAAAFRGVVGNAEVVAVVTTMGTDAAQLATSAVLDHASFDHVIVAGVAGGVDPGLTIGQLVVPESVVHLDSGRELHPLVMAGHRSSGVLATSDELHYGADAVRALLDAGITAIDMETAAVGAVCEDRGRSWSVFRAISDRVQDAGTNYDAFALARPDGTPDGRAVARFVLTRPWRLPYLARLGTGTHRAIKTAAAATIATCRELGA